MIFRRIYKFKNIAFKNRNRAECNKSPRLKKHNYCSNIVSAYTYYNGILEDESHALHTAQKSLQVAQPTCVIYAS